MEVEMQRVALVVGGVSTLNKDEVHCLRGAGISCTPVAEAATAVDMARGTGFDVILIDLCSTAFDGARILHALARVRPEISIIAFTDTPDLEKQGADFESGLVSYVPRSLGPDLLLWFVEQSISRGRLRGSDKETRDTNGVRNTSPLIHGLKSGPLEKPSKLPPASLVGSATALQTVRRQIQEVASTDMTVLIEGETGTGKDLVARAIHEASGRAETGAFVKISCPTLPEYLLESELFGHEAGAFTGALKRKPGRLEIAGHGSAFLDEVTEIPLSIQAKLLEVMEQKVFTRVGGTAQIVVEARIIPATNASFSRLFETHQFREDLYFRLNQYSIYLPPLRERIEDIPTLVDYFLQNFGPLYGREGLSVSPHALSRLAQYRWPGNVRELESAVRRFALSGDESKLFAAFLHPVKQKSLSDSGTYHESEKKVILEALSETRWNRRRAAETLGISYNTLRRRIARYDLEARTTPSPTI